MSAPAVDRSVAELHHDAVTHGEALQALVATRQRENPEDPKLKALDEHSAAAWDVVANLDTALRAR